MKLVDMKRPKPKPQDEKPAMADPGSERYPWGLGLTFDEEDLAKLPGLQKANAGDQVVLQISGKVTEVSISDEPGNRRRHSVRIQGQKVAVMNKSDDKTAFKNYKD